MNRPVELFSSGVGRNSSLSPVGGALFFACLILGGLAAGLTGHPAPVVIGTVLAFYFLFAIRVAAQWDKAAVLRLGRYRGLRGPGWFHIIPIVDTVSEYVDQRIRVTDVRAETALRESIGRHELAQMITERETLGHELQRILDEKTNPWGITVQSVEIRDVNIPKELEDAMSRRAQAERERQARIILGTAETEISDKFAQAALVYRDNPIALHLRAMNMLYEAIKEKGSMVIVPSSVVETMGLGGMLGTAALGGAAPGATAPGDATKAR